MSVKQVEVVERRPSPTVLLIVNVRERKPENPDRKKKKIKASYQYYVVITLKSIDFFVIFIKFYQAFQVQHSFKVRNKDTAICASSFQSKGGRQQSNMCKIP